VIEIENYAYQVPFVETEQEIFLKTIIPSRKFTKKYLRAEGVALQWTIARHDSAESYE